MRTCLNSFFLCVCFYPICNAQIGGLIGKIGKSGKEENAKYSTTILKNYINHYKTLTKTDFIDNEIANTREKAAQSLSIDSAKQMYEYVQKNIKRYTENSASAEEYIAVYTGFNSQFEANVITKINEKLKIPYTEKYEIQDNEFVWLKNTRKAIQNIKSIYTGTYNLSELNTSLEAKKSEYAASLIKTKSLFCAEQLDYFKQLRFSNSGNENDCVRGKDNFESDATDNGVYLYYTGEIQLYNCRIYIDGKETNLSLSVDDIADVNNGSKKSNNGWYKIQLLPGLKDISGRSLSRLSSLIKNYSLNKNSEINISYNGSNQFKYNLSKYSGTVGEYLNQINSSQLKSVKLTDTKYKNALVEKETIDAYNKFKTINPQYDEGEVKKVSVAGDNWTVYKTKIGLIDYQQTDAYFVLKGKDGNCYEDFRKIRKVYDSKTKTYGPIKVVGAPDKKEISCDLIK